MSPLKKKIYIIVIIVNVVLTGAIWIWSKQSNIPQTPSNLSPLAVPTATTTSPSSEIRTPAVFPADNQFDLSVLEASNFQSLRVYKPLTVQQSELGRDDPFKPY